MPLTRAQKKFLAIERAKMRLRNRLADIDYELDVLMPALQDLAELEQKKNVEIEMGNGTEDQD